MKRRYSKPTSDELHSARLMDDAAPLNQSPGGVHEGEHEGEQLGKQNWFDDDDDDGDSIFHRPFVYKSKVWD